MPQNFQDVIVATRKLNLRYTWIDSLCIIQDDQNDWKIEAAKMHSVYSWAYLTVVATCSRSTHEGFLRPRYSNHEHITMPYYSHEDGLIHGEFYLDPQFRRLESTAGSSEIAFSTWNSRGWTFQERMLSARLLHFCERRLCFECRCSDQTEDHLPPDYQQSFWLKGDLRRAKNWTAYLPTKEPQRTYQSWYRLIQEYTVREFTFDTDLYPAILGLVDEMKTIIKDDCFWGLWTGDFPRGLLWCKPHEHSPSEPVSLSKPSKTRAPSWSWISVNGSITWFRHKHNAETKFGLSLLQYIDTEQPPEAEFWATRVRARIRKLSAYVHARPSNRDWPFRLFCEGVGIGEGCFDVEEPSAGRQIWIMEVESDHTSARKSHDANRLAALLLESYNGLQDGFCRVGFALKDEGCKILNNLPLKPLLCIN
jgi:hypothetical protein